MKAVGHMKEFCVPELDALIEEGVTVTVPWTEREEAILSKYYGRVPTKDLCKAINKSSDSVLAKARRMGIGFNREKNI